MKRLLQCRTRADMRQLVKVCMALLFLFIIFNIYKRWSKSHDGRHIVLWYNPPFYVTSRTDAFVRNFDECPQANCRLTFDQSEAESSKAIIFDGRQMTKNCKSFSRPQDQMWVFWGNEPPTKYNEAGDEWMDFAKEFNLTMTYHRESDVYMPYGEIVPTMPIPQKDFLSIAQKKNHSVVWIASSCHTSSWREMYVKELRKYVDVDIFGRCSDAMTPWNCGNRWKHDDCFSVLNDYKFYLAFENSLCEDYITEKFFENYNYDIIIVTRGGTKSNFKDILPDGVYIDAMDFQNPKELGGHLKQFLNDDKKYANLLERKSAYTSLPYHIVYQKSLCNLCDRIMYPEVYNVARYDNLRDTLHEINFCKHPSDLERKHQR